MQYIVTRPIMDLCKEMVRILGTWVEKGGEKKGLDLVKARAVVAASEEDSKEEERGDSRRSSR